MVHFAQQLNDLSLKQQPFVIVTLTDIKGSAPQILGAKMIVVDKGLHWGTVGGGKIEAHCIKYAQGLLASNGESVTQSWNLQTDIGMSCGGAVTMFFEIVKPQAMNIAIFGAGHVSQELCRVLSTWNASIQVYDTRAEWLEKLPSSANINKKLSVKLADEVPTLPEGSFIVSMTMGHATDVPVLVQALKQPGRWKFVGVIGSDVKAKKIRNELKEHGVSSECIDKLVSPLGLPLGNNTPSEIAISIAAQLIAVRDNLSFQVVAGISPN